MGINITEKTDYSYLFNSLNSSSTSNAFNGFNLSDYASIKNGSYGKLLKAYYTKQDSETDSTSSKDKTKDKTSETVKKLTTVQSNASALQDSASKLISKGSGSLFKEKDITTKDENGVETTTRGYDTEAIYSAVSDFASKYNAFIKSAADTSASGITRQNSNLKNLVANYKTSLAKVGITINSDNTLSVDETKFKASDMNSVKTLFNGNTSFAYSVATKASLIGTNAASEANAARNYTSSGDYSSTYSAGNLLDSIV